MLSVSIRRTIAATFCFMGLVVATTSFAQEVTLRFASFPGPTNFLNTGLLEPWFKKLEDESGGKLKVEFLMGGSAAAPGEVFDSVEAGLFDMGWSITSYNPGRFAAAGVTELPLLATGSTESTAAIAALYDKGLIDGFANVKVLGIATADIARLHHADEITGLADFKGAKVRAAGNVLSAMIAAIGSGKKVGVTRRVRAGLVSSGGRPPQPGLAGPCERLAVTSASVASCSSAR